jgi:hypothetical protein
MSKPSLAEMQKRDLPHATSADVAAQIERFAVKLPSAVLDEYLSHFVKPSGDHGCPRDGGFFTWGIVHGCGHCAGCGWPGRLYHFPKDETGNTHRFEALLWCHPDDLEERKSA